VGGVGVRESGKELLQKSAERERFTIKRKGGNDETKNE